jgi:trehalose 6-phosphate synthase
MAGTYEIVVVSNRGPSGYTTAADGTLASVWGGGGLVAVLGPGVAANGAAWLSAAPASSGSTIESAAGLVPLELDEAVYRSYYQVVANQALWFCLHGLWDLPRRPRFDRHFWQAWRDFRWVSEQFAACAAAEAAPGATVLVHDFQLALVPALLAKRRPDLHIGSFVHTPWCSPQELSVLPDEVAVAILDGMGSAACGFHARRWAEAFSACHQQWLGSTAQTFVSPAAPDVERLKSLAESAECEAARENLEGTVEGRILIVRVERVELSKNVLRGFWAFDELLESRPDLRGNTTFAAMLYPSRGGVADYLAYGQEVQSLAAHLNAKWQSRGWTPVLLDQRDDHATSVAALQRADVLLVNPVRDGLNLVAKEGPLVNERDAPLVLSRQAGAWDELGELAIGVNPFDVSETAEALARAIDMAKDERAARAKALRTVSASRTPLQWFDDQLAAARGASRRRAGPPRTQGS